MENLPDHVKPYKSTPVFTQDSVPSKLLGDHQTAPGRWGVIHVKKGSLQYIIDPNESHIITPDHPGGIIKPEQPHRVKPLGEVEFYVEFHK